MYPSAAWYVASRTHYIEAAVLRVPSHLILYPERGSEATTSLTVLEVSPVDQKPAPWVTGTA